MNVLVLKIIALSTMIIDHYGAIFQSDILAFRIVGRLAFPIYCFLLIEGYFHTSNVKSYAKRLLIFAIISEVPFDLAFYEKIGFVHQNIFFTLFIGLVAVYLIDNKDKKYNFDKSAVIIAACLLAVILSVDYNIIGIIYILVLYFTRSYDKLKRFKIVGFTMLVANFASSLLQQFSLLALIPMYFYNNELGPKNKIIQILFYAAYPLHLLIFYIIKISIWL
ncbi:MAG: TraX family protein [Sedimentibacter sp.]